ncbi:MAG: sulfur oxidation protein SoxZ [Rhodospirillaceae bacterium]|nr:MAG: sulfur oxidation protein SoxZ [Rhodospirillaceae bacterium]
MSEVKGRARVQKTARKGDVIEIKTTISHPMENGTRKDGHGNVVPRKYITGFKCLYNGTEIFRSEWQPSVSANPFLSFFVTATESGMLDFEWTEDTGQVFKESSNITVEG